MKTQLLKILVQIIELLVACGQPTKASWFRDRMELLRSEDVESLVFINIVFEIKGIIAGMGSFSDLSLQPLQSSKITRDEARLMQGKLAEDLDEIVYKLMGKLR